MKSIFLLMVLFTNMQTLSAQQKALYVGWGKTYEGPNKSKMFLSKGSPFYEDREGIISYYKVTITQPENDGVVIIPLISKVKDTLYCVFCRIWAWEYVVTVEHLPKQVFFNPVSGSLVFQLLNKKQEFQRVILTSNPGIVYWDKKVKNLVL